MHIFGARIGIASTTGSAHVSGSDVPPQPSPFSLLF
jgi:hypothetical protein